jgi:hypothetical protein
MGCFDYECECHGKTCNHVGSQLYNSNVVIEVPLSDHTVVYLKGQYDEYGYVKVGEYTFYLEQFQEYFEGWLDDEQETDREKIFLATRVWTLNETIYTTTDDGKDVPTHVHRKCYTGDARALAETISPATLSKCIRIDMKIDLDDLRLKRIERLKSSIDLIRAELGRTNRP